MFLTVGCQVFWPTLALFQLRGRGATLQTPWWTSHVAQLERKSTTEERHEPDTCWQNPTCLNNEDKRETRRLIDESIPTEHGEASVSTMHLDFFAILLLQNQWMGCRFFVAALPTTVCWGAFSNKVTWSVSSDTCVSRVLPQCVQGGKNPEPGCCFLRQTLTSPQFGQCLR